MMSTMMARERQLSMGLEQGGVESACLENMFLGKSVIAGSSTHWHCYFLTHL